MICCGLWLAWAPISEAVGELISEEAVQDSLTVKLLEESQVGCPNRVQSHSTLLKNVAFPL